MVVDSSSLVCILQHEPERRHHLARIAAANEPVMSVINAFEAAIVIGGRLGHHERAGQLVASALGELGIRLVDVPSSLLADCVQTYARYGKGTGHPAHLNFGDCISYALAKRLDTQLLYKGDDFSRTDLASI